MELVDHRAARARFARQARRAAGRSRICAELGARLAARLEPVKVPAGLALDLGCGACPGADMRGTGEFSGIIGADWCAPMQPCASLPPCVASCACAAEHLPFADCSFAFVWSCLLLPWSPAPGEALAEARRVLAEGGLLALCTLGPGSLGELRTAFAGQPCTQGFLDMHDLGDLLVTAGFADPVLDCDVLALECGSATRLFAELREAGVLAVPGMSKGLRGKDSWAAATAVLERLRGGLRVTLEAVFAHAWAAPRRPAQPGGSWRRMMFEARR